MKDFATIKRRICEVEAVLESLRLAIQTEWAKPMDERSPYLLVFVRKELELHRARLAELNWVLDEDRTDEINLPRCDSAARRL